jgi:hypothetical protein
VEKREKEVKASVVLSPELDMTFCSFMRRVLRDHLDEYLEEPNSCGYLTRWAGAASDDPLGDAVMEAARLWRLTPADMARLIVASEIARYIEQGRQRWQTMAEAVNPSETAAIEERNQQAGVNATSPRNMQSADQAPLLGRADAAPSGSQASSSPDS